VEPIAPLCRARGNKTWKGVIRIHLKNPSKDGIELLEGKHIFALVIVETLTIAKVCKRYDNLALHEQLATKITSDNLIGVAAYTIMQQMIVDSYRRRYEFEVTQVIKSKLEDSHAWIITTSPEQRNKTMKHKVAINGELIRSTTNNSEKLTKAELAKKNCLMLIAVNLNMHKTTEEVEHGIKEILGDKNVINLYFPKRRDNAHNGIVNVEYQFPTTYKQYVKQMVKLYNKYVKFTLHPRNMDRMPPVKKHCGNLVFSTSTRP
jgi:deoxyribodipyrimidine photolyase